MKYKAVFFDRDGTLTYFDQDGNFGALGHGIGNGQTKDLLRLSDGRLYKAQVLGIKKGVRGTPGELEGVVYYGKDNQIGEVSSNTQIGIYGTLTKNFREEKKNESLLCRLQTGDSDKGCGNSVGCVRGTAVISHRN